MKGCFGGCLGRLAALVLLAVLVVAAWRFGPEISQRAGELWDRDRADAPAASPAMAEAALGRLAELTGGEGGRGTFTALEVESVLRYGLDDPLPAGVGNPEVEFRDDELRLSVEVARELLPSIPEMDRIRDALPETVPIQIRGALLTLEEGRGAIVIRRVDAAGVPVPRRFHRSIAQVLNPSPGEGLPPEAVVFALPSGITSVHLAGDELVVDVHP